MQCALKFSGEFEIDSTIKNIATVGKWGGNLAMIALSIVLERPIALINSSITSQPQNISNHMIGRIMNAKTKYLLNEPINILLYKQHFTALLPHKNFMLEKFFDNHFQFYLG